jgi:AcrR family transcriptional regulator
VTDSDVDTRDRILAVATTLFYRQGYGGTSMNSIAAELNISGPALYWHFKSKQELCFEAVKAELDRFVSGLRPASREPGPAAQLSAFVGAYVELKLRQSETLETPGASGVYRQLRDSLTQAQRETLDGLQRQVVKQLRSILRRGQKAGDFEFEDLTVTTFAIITLCEYVFSWFDPDGPLSIAEVGDDYRGLVLAMVGAGA